MKLTYILLSLVILLTACNTTPEGPEEDLVIVNSEDNVATSVHVKTVKKIFYNVPSPLEITSMLKKAGASYNSEYLNSFKKVSEYTTMEEMALNLGVYGADLSYYRLYYCRC